MDNMYDDIVIPNSNDHYDNGNAHDSTGFDK